MSDLIMPQLCRTLLRTAKAGQVLERLRRGFSEFAPRPRANSVLASCLDTAKFEYSSCLGSCLILSVSDLELLNSSII